MLQTDFQCAVMAIQMEYVDMPGLTLTISQVARLCMLPSDVCQAALETLVVAGFLGRAIDGAYLRRGTPPVSIEHLDPLTWAVVPRAGALARH